MTLKNKTLIILIPGFPANEVDSTCLPFPQTFVKHLKLLNPGLNIKVLAFQYPFFESVYEWHGVEVHAFNGRNIGGFRRLFLWRTIWRRLKKILQEEQILGILSFWMGETALIAKYAAKKYGVRSFTWLMGQDARENNRYISITRPKSESLIALSDFLADEYYKNYKIKPANTITPGIDVASFPAKSKERKIDILGVGSLIPLKQFDQIIRLVAEIVDSHPGVRAVICGEGPERGKLQQLIHDFHLSNQIELRGEPAPVGADRDAVGVLPRRQRGDVQPGQLGRPAAVGDPQPVEPGPRERQQREGERAAVTGRRDLGRLRVDPSRRVTVLRTFPVGVADRRRPAGNGRW